MTQPNTQAPADDLPPLPDDDKIEGRIYQDVREFVSPQVKDVIREMMSEYARAALASQPAQAETVVPEFNGWYCAQCQCGVDSRDVTYHEQHTACGRVITNDRPPTPPQAQPAPVAVDERPDCFEFAMDFLGGQDAEKVRAYVETLEARAALQSARSGQAGQGVMDALIGMLDAFTNPESGEVDRRLAIKDARAALAASKEKQG